MSCGGSEADWAAYCENYAVGSVEGFESGATSASGNQRRLPLFCIDPKGLVRPFIVGTQKPPAAGSTILALAWPNGESQVAAADSQAAGSAPLTG